MKERYIAKFQQGNTKLHLLELTDEVQQIRHDENFNIYISTNEVWIRHKYQVRLNRKRIDTSTSEYEMRKLFATYIQNIVLQLKIY